MSFKRPSLLASAAAVLFAMAACTTVTPEKKPPVATPQPSVQQTPVPPVSKPVEIFQPVVFAALPGWERDDLREAWPAYAASCEVLVKREAWNASCLKAREVDANDVKAIRAFFETNFVPYRVFNQDGSDNGLITGYYEPLLYGARRRGGAFQTPLYRTPDDLLTIDLTSLHPDLKNMRLRGRVVGKKVVPYLSRAELENSSALAGKELMWVNDPIEAFFLQVQGSGRVQLVDEKETVRIAYADQNGHPYKSIGRYLVDKGEMTLDQASAQNIKAWYIAHPARQQELLNANPSFVFFKEEKISDPRKGPKGAMGLPLTPERSIAVDAQFIPLGAPVFLSTTQPNSDVALQRLMLAQDTGGAIRNAVRADFFWGFGAEAGEKAGRMKQRGAVWVLLPRAAPLSTLAP